MLLGSEISDQNLLVKRRLLPCSLSVMAPVYYFLFYNYYSNILNFIDQQAERIKIADLDPGYFSCHSSTPPNLWSRARVALTTSIDFFLKFARGRFLFLMAAFIYTFELGRSAIFSKISSVLSIVVCVLWSIFSTGEKI